VGDESRDGERRRKRKDKKENKEKRGSERK